MAGTKGSAAGFPGHDKAEMVGVVREDSFTVAVEAEAGPAGEVLVRRFRLGARVVEVVEVLDRWLGANHLYVKLRGLDGATWILRRDAHGGWRLVLFRDRRAVDPGR